jgi:hypothetical protein
MLMSLCRYFGVDPNYLLGYDKPRTIPEWLLPWAGDLEDMDPTGQELIVLILRMMNPRSSDGEPQLDGPA